MDYILLKNVYGLSFHLLLTYVTTNSRVCVVFHQNRIEIGFKLKRDYWNKGITTEALSAVMNFLFNEVGMHRITAKHDIENPASGIVLQKCGMQYAVLTSKNIRLAFSTQLAQII